jgi:hypothetical protein
MKIRRNSPDLLIVEDRPWLLGLMIILFILIFCGAGLTMLLSGEWLGLLFFLAGGGLGFGAFWAFVRRVQVVFYRPEGWVEIRRANIMRRLATRFDLAGVHRALVETSTSDGKNLHRVALFVEKGGVTGTKPLTLAYSNVGDHHGVASAINAWLGVSETG